MSCKVMYTCDHCGKEVSPYIGKQWKAGFLTVGPNIDDIHACSKEHLTLALAKTFDIPLDASTLRLVTEKNEALETARAVIIERDTMHARLAEFEARMPANEVTNAERAQYEATIEMQRKRIEELEKRIAELTEPMTVDGKTPGQVALEAWNPEANGYSAYRDDWERSALAVLRAFGQPSQTTQDAAEALRRVRNAMFPNPHGPSDPEAEYQMGIIDDELAKLEAKPAGKAPECFLCGKGPHDHTMMVLESLPEQFEVKWCNGRRQNFGTEKPAWWDVPKSDHVHELGSCSFCDKQPPNTSAESGTLPDAVLAAITLPTKPTKPLVDYEPLFWKLLASLTLADNIKDVANDVGEAFEQTGAKMHDDATDVWENIRRHCIDNGITTLQETELSSIEYEEGEDDQ